MLKKLHFSGVFLIGILFLCVFSLLLSTSSIQMLLLFMAVLSMGLYVPFLIKGAHKQKQNDQLLYEAHVLHQSIEQFSEYAIFTLNGNLIKSSHSHLYGNLLDFLKNLDVRFKYCAQWPQFKRWIEEQHMGEIILKVPLNSQEKEKVFLGRVLPHDQPYFAVQSLFIGFEELTPQFAEIESLQKDLNTLQTFVDTAPFAMFHLNQSSRVVGCNQTFISWMCQEKERILEMPINQFLDGFDNAQTSKPRIVHVKPFRYPPFKAILVSSLLNLQTKVFLLCKLDEALSSDMLMGTTEETFLKAPIPGIIIRQNGEVVSFNRSYQQLMLTALPQNSITINSNFFELLTPVSSERLHGILKPNVSTPVECTLIDGKTHCIAYTSQINTGRKEYLLQLMDISQQKQLEQQFIQSQKMQAVGQLAGGIAHDFNNLLTAMIGFCDLLLQRYMPNDPSYLDVSQIKQNANRAANLVRQLLAFSRQQSLQPRVVNITDTLVELTALLRRLIGAKIDLDVIHGRDLWPVKVDVSQFEQVIINLAVNSRDAMADGGKLTIKTYNISNTTPTRIGHETVPVGDFVVIDVNDTGSGIKEEYLEHIFEPFFSTKEVGAGTGLGLATVYGIVKQTEGFIFVESKVKKGTTFTIYLPRHSNSAESTEIPLEVLHGDLSGFGRILLVEDEDAVRMFSARALREKGYDVIEASNGHEALELIQEGLKFDVLVTDVVMPQMDGTELNKKVRKLIPNLKTIFISGYTEDAFRKNLGDDIHIHFLPKPFTLKDLAAKVKDVIT